MPTFVRLLFLFVAWSIPSAVSAAEQLTATRMLSGVHTLVPLRSVSQITLGNGGTAKDITSPFAQFGPYVAIGWEPGGQYLTSLIPRAKVEFLFDETISKPTITFLWKGEQVPYPDTTPEYAGWSMNMRHLMEESVIRATIRVRMADWPSEDPFPNVP